MRDKKFEILMAIATAIMTAIWCADVEIFIQKIFPDFNMPDMVIGMLSVGIGLYVYGRLARKKPIQTDDTPTEEFPGGEMRF